MIVFTGMIDPLRANPARAQNSGFYTLSHRAKSTRGRAVDTRQAEE